MECFKATSTGDFLGSHSDDRQRSLLSGFFHICASMLPIYCSCLSGFDTGQFPKHWTLSNFWCGYVRNMFRFTAMFFFPH